MNLFTKALTSALRLPGARAKAVTFDDGTGAFNTFPFGAIDAAYGPLASVPGFGFGVPGGLVPSQENAYMYASHPGVRAVVDTLARNVAQLPLDGKQAGRNGATDLPAGNVLADLLRDPDPTQPTSLWKAVLVVDLLVHGESIHVLVDDRVLVRLDPVTTDVQGKGSQITGYASGGRVFDVADVLHIRFFNPLNPRRGLSPLTSIRGLVGLDLAEQDARMRRAGMPPVMVKRPLDSPKWSDTARIRFEERISALLKGARRGSVPTLEEGMELAPIPGPSEADYVASRQMVLTTICGVLGVPSQATSASDRNLDAARRGLYMDAVAPLASMIADAINLQLVPRLLGPVQTAGGRIYVEFNLSAQMWGSIKEQTTALAEATGGPWQTPNESRAIVGLPPVAGGDTLYPPKATPPGGGAA